MDLCPTDTRGQMLEQACSCDGERCEAQELCQNRGCRHNCVPNATVLRQHCYYRANTMFDWCTQGGYYDSQTHTCIEQCKTTIGDKPASGTCNCEGQLCEQATHVCYALPGARMNSATACLPRCQSGQTLKSGNCVCIDYDTRNSMLCRAGNMCYAGQCTCSEGSAGPCVKKDARQCKATEIFVAGACVQPTQSCSTAEIDTFPVNSLPCLCGNEPCAVSPLTACATFSGGVKCVPSCPLGDYFEKIQPESQIIFYHQVQCACKTGSDGRAMGLKNAQRCSEKGIILDVCIDSTLIGEDCACADAVCGKNSFCYKNTCASECQYMAGVGCYCGDLASVAVGTNLTDKICYNIPKSDGKQINYCVSGVCTQMCDWGLQTPGATCICENQRSCAANEYCGGGFPGMDAKCVLPCASVGMQSQRCMCSTWYRYAESVCEPGDYCLEPTYAEITTLPSDSTRCYKPCSEATNGESCMCSEIICPRGYFCHEGWCTQCNHLFVECTRCVDDVCFEVMFKPANIQLCPTGFGFENGSCRRCSRGQRQRAGVCDSILLWWEILLIALSGVIVLGMLVAWLLRTLWNLRHRALKEE